MTKKYNFSFSEFKNKNQSKTISGNTKGEKIRKEWDLDNIENINGVSINITIPEGIFLAPSLIQGIFGDTIAKIDLNKFYEIYKIEGTLFIVDKINRIIKDLYTLKEN